MIRVSRWLGIAVLVALPVRRAPAQLTLSAALREADAGAYANRIAGATAAAQRAEALVPLRGVLPSVRVETGFLRTTDPVGAFGTMLRQRAVTPAAFDPARLNDPAPANDYTGALVLEAPVLNLDAWAGRRGAGAAADAGRAAAEWTRLGTRADVVRAYYGAVLAAERVTTLDAALRAARAHVAQVEAMQRQGLVTKSDRLLAGVRAGEVESQLVEARGGASTALRQLALVLGRDGDAPAVVPLSLPDDGRIRAVVAEDTAPRGPVTPAVRSDVRAAELSRDAARADVLRARATLLPRVNAVARYDWNSVARPYGGEKSWTVGVMASWPLFSGGSELGDVRAAGSRADAAQAGVDAAAARARLEREQARTALAVALTRLTLAEANVAQSAEARRLVERRYAGGLATITELLDAQAAETGSALARSAARYDAIAADAELRRTLGADPGALAVLDTSVTDGRVASGAPEVGAATSLTPGRADSAMASAGVHR